jgi:microcystin-dependent protein
LLEWFISGQTLILTIKLYIMDCYIGEIRPFAFGIVPSGWHLCDGALLPIQQNQALYALIGTAYGSATGQFALPDFRGRTPVFTNYNLNYKMGFMAGSENVTLSSSQIPMHSHVMEVANAPGVTSINTNRPAIPTSGPTVTPTVTASMYTPDVSQNTYLAINTLEYAGGNNPHNNLQPFQTVNYCIALQGNWPSRE